MTAIYYPDCEAASPNGMYTLEARSPHNGTINRQNGKPSSRNEFGFKYREHQSEFRYRLIDNTRKPLLGRLLGKKENLVVWERWQGTDEDSPRELVVSDDGWSIICTHGFNPEVMAVSPAGEATLRVKITFSGSEQKNQSEAAGSLSWSPDCMAYSTAGLEWTDHSWRCFFHHQGGRYFSWRTSTGQRLILDLKTPALVAEPAPSDPLAPVLAASEKQSVCDLLSEFSSRMDDVHRWFGCKTSEEAEQAKIDPRIRFMTSALQLAGAYRLEQTIPFLREWEKFDYLDLIGGPIAMPGDWRLEKQIFRPIIHHSLRLLGQEPLGLATYQFVKYDKTRYPMPEQIADRQTRAGQIRPEMSAEDVLQRLGSPDHIRRHSRKVGQFYRSWEEWEYDFRSGGQWSTFRISWEEEKQKARITRIETVPPYWLETDRRELEILSY